MCRKIFIIITFIMIAGCTLIKHVPLSQENSITLSGKVLQNSVYEKPDFSAMTPGKATLGLIGAVAMISAGNEIIQKNSVEDPASYIGKKLSEILSDKYDMKIAQLKPTVSTSDNINVLINIYDQADFILDIKTINWSFTYFPLSWDKYRVIYTARLRIIDTKRKMVIAEEFYKHIPDYSEDTPSYDYLVGNNASGLKYELGKVADYCIEFFKDEAFQM